MRNKKTKQINRHADQILLAIFSLKSVSEDFYNRPRKKRHLEACTAFSKVDLKSKKGRYPGSSSCDSKSPDLRAEVSLLHHKPQNTSC